MKLTIGNKYNWKGDSKVLVYVGKKGCWHQFAPVDYPSFIWCECLDSDIQLMEQSQ